MFGNFPAQTTHICGCYYATGDSNPFRSNRRYLPQVKLASYTTIGPLCFTTVTTQTFSNPCDEVIDEPRYTFPLYDGVAVNGYTITYAGKVLKGVVKQKDDAKQTYQEAVERGETAGLLESLPAGIFGVTLSNVPAKGDVVVEITYCGELKHDAAIDGLRYTLPTSIAPRYGSYPGEVLHSNAQASGGISITVDVDMVSSAIRKVQSPSHPIAVSSGSLSTAVSRDAFKPHQASASLTLGTTELAQDFVLQLLVDDVDKPRAMLETHPTLPNQRAIMATMVPSFTLEPAHPEIVFIADQSGSMEGIKNAALVKALKIFLKSLPLGICFNICAFGNHFKYLWPQSQAYTASNLQQAVDFVETFSAAYGGTQILQPIVAAFEQRLDDMPLEVILLTDGQVWREEDVFKYINEHVHEKKVDARVFALGIGDGVSHTLVEGVARAGNGFAQFVTPGEEVTGMDRKVVRMLKGALYAHTKDYRLEVVYAEDGDAGATRNCSASSASSDGTLTPGVGETDDDFELVEKFGSGLQLEEKDAVGPAVDEKDEKPTMSFFDSSADLDKPVNGGQDGAKRYAHLPAIDPPALLQAPPDIPPLFPFNRTTVYLLLGPEAPQKRVTAVVLRATSAEGSLELTVPVDYVEGSNAIPAVHQLAARKAIRDLEEGRGWLSSATITSDGGQTMTIKERYRSLFDELTEREAVRLGEKFQVAGKWTSFAAVQEGTEETSPQTAAEGTARRPRSAGGILRMDTKAEAMQACMDPGNYQVDQAIQHAKTKRSVRGSLFGGFARPAATTQGGGLFGGFGSVGKNVSRGELCSSSDTPQSSLLSTNSSACFGAPTLSAVPGPQAPGISMGRSGGLFSAGRLFGRSSMVVPPPTPPCSGAQPPPPPPACPKPAGSSLFGGSDAPGFLLASASASPSALLASSSETIVITSNIEPVRAMHKLISLQTFSGAWLWSDELADIIGCDIKIVPQVADWEQYQLCREDDGNCACVFEVQSR